MNKFTIKKVVEINFEKGKAKLFPNKEKTVEAYNKLIDSLDEHFEISVIRRLSPMGTPILVISYKSIIDCPFIYCFDGRYYFHLPTAETTITSDVSEVLKLIKKHFSRFSSFNCLPEFLD